MKTNLNLIPEYKKREIQYRSIFLRVVRWGMEFMIIYIGFILLLFAVSYILKLNLQTNLIQLNPNNIARFNEFKEKDNSIKDMNSLVLEIKKIQSGQLNWTKFFSKLEEMVVEGIVINRISTKDYSILLTGNSNNRDNMLAFKEKLSRDECFTEIDLPLSYLVPKENLDFQITFNLNKDCIK